MKKKIFIFFIILFLFFIYSYSYANDELVYVDNNNIDTKYHRITCNHIFPNGYHSITVEEAFDIGYRRCPDCSPSISDTEKQIREKEFQEIVESVSASSNTSSTSTITSSDEDVVYVTSKGSKYHLKDCSYLDNSSQVHKVMLKTAISKGYVACKVCNPYGMAETTEEKSSNNLIIIIISIALILLIIYIILNERRYKKTHAYGIPTTDLKK